MTQAPVRVYGRGHLHFITFSCYERRRLLGPVLARDTFVGILGEVRDAYGFALVGYVVMPEHVHLLIGESARGTPSLVVQVLKQRVSRRLRVDDRAATESGSSGPENGAQSLPRFWQRRFYDFNVWSLKKRVEKIQYMHRNPVKRGLVTDPREWSWSSFSSYSKSGEGMIRIDR